jgi:hypothetical protein
MIGDRFPDSIASRTFIQRRGRTAAAPAGSKELLKQHNTAGGLR